jgi:leucine dehydrogenase
LEPSVTVRIEELAPGEAHRVLRVEDSACGLMAFIVLDDLRLGPAAGGVRTWSYENEASALRDARGLARAMTYKCAISGLDAGGGKAVVMAGPDLDRPRAFKRLGEVIETLGGDFRTAGDVGTTSDDLETMNRVCSWVHCHETSLARSVAWSVCAALTGALSSMKAGPLKGRTASVQGAGSIGTEVVRLLTEQGVRVTVTDLNPERAHAIASETGASVCAPDALWSLDSELVIPCALGGVIDIRFAERTEARLICGGANNILAGPHVEELLSSRGVTYVPDFISSAGGVIDGIGESVMGLADRGPLIHALAETTRAVLNEARSSDTTATRVARDVAERRLAGR